MAKNLLSLQMSQIIACDAPLLSPIDSWDMHLSPTPDPFSYAFYNMPPSPPISDASPVPPAKMLKTHATLDSPDLLCLPTHQVFDLPPETARPPTPASRSPSLAAEDMATSNDTAGSSCGSKRSASPAPSATKKRAIGERISSKDFVPPDVSGLSKREARLVKNRAAAFLSRQRKREEFECMEVRVAELEQENARLLALSSSLSAPQPQKDTELVSEVQQLRAQLATLKERERTLSAQLASSTSPNPVVKVEDTEPSLSSPPRSSSTTVSSAHKSGASLGLMASSIPGPLFVLLCALPSLLSMRMQSTAPTSFAIPNPFPTSSASSFDYNSFLPSDYEWSKSTATMMDMDFDADIPTKHDNTAITRKLEFTGTDSDSLANLGDLDISFDTSPSDGGKIRVRIHPPSASSSRASSVKPDTAPVSPSSSESSVWSSDPDSKWGILSTSNNDPFLGVGSSESGDFGMMMPLASDGSIRFDHDTMSSPRSIESDASFGSGEFYVSPDGSQGSSSSGGKRRVRIALKSMPQAGGEGGEWEVQLC
ncbi:hypothetical protein M413DRAFT_73437 [Hebeloma cylindrosporum]|uniref:BZIP domain-containing protein n=1 Tax=Hebeloma cylindrosporum TaxID=76867 RepID=A0A0C3C7V9_HEBCY|nr:hypothetical protein M413DRAFT_73437 [Hebeloma cylindrosporum h7]